jgi:hypothetical protein
VLGSTSWMAFVLYVVFSVKPYSFVGMSAVFLAFNMLPLTRVAFLLIQGLAWISFDSISKNPFIIIVLREFYCSIAPFFESVYLFLSFLLISRHSIVCANFLLCSRSVA